jgi:transposase
MAVSLPDARHLSDEVLEALRLRALRGCELGFSEGDVADLLGVARETVSRWFSAYQSAGLDALPHQRSGRPLGSGRTLSDAQATHLQQILDSRSPEQVGVPAPLWNRRAVRELIRQQYGIVMPVRTVGAYLRRWGYTAKRPRRHSVEQDPEEVRLWLEETYPTLQRRAAEEGATIHWCDETGVAADEHVGRGYARKGQPATVEVPDSHVRVNVVSTITNDGAVHFMSYTETMTAALFITFLEQLLRSCAGKLFVIVDWLPAHDAWEVLDWAEAHLDRLELFFLPPYAPERNADEYLNNDLKGQVNAEGLPRNKPELRSRIEAVLQRLAQLPERIRHYFQHPAMQYVTELN